MICVVVIISLQKNLNSISVSSISEDTHVMSLQIDVNEYVFVYR
jgi:hypothetical protein